jgi:hypothetical protein
MRSEAARTSFSEEKEAKRLFCYVGTWALAAPQPTARRDKSFCAAFFKKRLLS